MRCTLTFREARPASTAWNVTKTLLLTGPFWAVFYFGFPILFFWLEEMLGLSGYRFGSLFWTVVGAVLFVAGSVLHLGSNLVMAVFGEGTPMTLDCPRKLVIAGPYRHVRNPMAIASLMQSVGIGLVLGSPMVLVYCLLLLLLDHFILRPFEEADVERRFGDAYRRYRQYVMCWRPRWKGFDPGRDFVEDPIGPERTTPPTRYVVLFDGHCKFCAVGARQLVNLGQPGTLQLDNFQEPAVLDQFPGFSYEGCMKQMYLVTPEGRVFAGFEAAVRAVATRPLLGWIAFAYYLPGVRFFSDMIYAMIARNRYRIMGKALEAGECESGSCALHLPKK
jgi:predicted DCC family thiol-disulfide oxidoreductase YuxK/protein-S-isoprenylcysteine O-methyltransferase Ste14